MTKETQKTDWASLGANYSVMVMPLAGCVHEEVVQSYIEGMEGYNLFLYQQTAMSRSQMEASMKAEGRYALVDYNNRNISIPKTMILISNFNENDKDLISAVQEDIAKISAIVDCGPLENVTQDLQNVKKLEKLILVKDILTKGVDSQPPKYLVDNMEANEPELKKSIIDKDNNFIASEGITFKTLFVPGL